MKRRKKRRNYHNKGEYIYVDSLSHLDRFIYKGKECFFNEIFSNGKVSFVYNSRPFLGGIIDGNTIVKI